jgi:hypothetical protein
MAKYKVVRPIEHNNTLYLPAGEARSASHGDIAVDSSGTIELSVQEAAHFTSGQLVPLAKVGSLSAQAATSKANDIDEPGFMPTPIKQ